MPGYCKAWNVLVNLGLTDDSFILENSEHLSFRDITQAFLPSSATSVADQLREWCGPDQDVFDRLIWLGILDETATGVRNASPAMVLQSLIERKWKLKDSDKDLVVMAHEFIYKQKGLTKKLRASLSRKGENAVMTGMAATVGLPMAICTRLLLEGKIDVRGVHIPVMKEIYEPVLAELASMGISFEEILD
jgi:saccharopine dehydrogenase (NADP+, L-glutamate forming)